MEHVHLGRVWGNGNIFNAFQGTCHFLGCQYEARHLLQSLVQKPQSIRNQVRGIDERPTQAGTPNLGFLDEVRVPDQCRANDGADILVEGHIDGRETVSDLGIASISVEGSAGPDPGAVHMEGQVHLMGASL